MKRLLIVLPLLFFSSILFAQPPVTEEQARTELEKLGLDEELVRQKLSERGIDIDNVDPNNPQELLQLQTALEEVAAEIKAEEGNTETTTDTSSSSVDDVVIDSSDAALESVTANDDEAAKAEAELENFQQQLPPAVIFGQHIFRDKSIKLYRQSRDIKPSDAYILGAGDEVAISIWGLSQKTSILKIGKSGYITPDRMPRILLKGISFGKAKELLRQRFSNYYRFTPEEFEVTVNYAKNVTINIVGEVFNYGSFTLPATNTAFNALVASGGPTDVGSVRNIQLMRAGKQPRRIDIYDYLFDPSVQDEFYLQENDFIHIPIAERQVTISGSVNRPFTYELIEGENLKKLVDLAGGFHPSAFQKNIQVRRFLNDQETIIDVDFRALIEANKDFQLFPGDYVQVKRIPQAFKNFVEISGSVEFPGRFELVEGMKISDLIAKGGLLTESKKDVAFVKRSNFDGTIKYEKVNLKEVIENAGSAFNIELQPQDNLIIFQKSQFTSYYEFSVSGAVRNQLKAPFSVGKEIKVQDAILLAGGLTPDATSFAYIRRIDTSNKKRFNYIRVDLKEAILNPSSSENIALEPADELVVYSNTRYSDDAFVNVTGAVRNPGEYLFAENLTLKDILTFAGGFKLEASKSRIDIFRIIIENNDPTQVIVATVEVDQEFNIINDNSNFQLQPYDMIAVRRIPEFELQRIVTIDGEAKYPGQYALISDNERILDVLKRAGGVTKEAFPEGATLYRQEDDTGFVIIELDEILKNKTARSNFILKQGDVIDIPKKKDLVTITGASKAVELYPEKVLEGGKINVAYHKGKNAKWYVDHYAAGVGKDGRKRLITVEHPNGQIEQTKRFLFFKNYPSVSEGSIISIGTQPPKPPRAERKKSKVDWQRTVQDVVASATAILTLVLLVQSTQ